MKYLTKEWYNTMQKCDIHILLEATNKAGMYSDEYFEKLYKRKEKKHINCWIEYYKFLNTDKIFGDYKGKRAKERIKWEKQYLLNDREFELYILEQKEVFNNIFCRNVKELSEKLPNEILNNIADIRVLALDKATPSVINQIKSFSENNRKAVDFALEQSEKIFKQNLKNEKFKFLKKFNFHDSKIMFTTESENNLILNIDPEGCYGESTKIILNNYKLIHSDKPIKNAWWLYDEVFAKDDGIEMHVLLQQEEDLIEFTVFADSIEIS